MVSAPNTGGGNYCSFITCCSRMFRSTCGNSGTCSGGYFGSKYRVKGVIVVVNSVTTGVVVEVGVFVVVKRVIELFDTIIEAVVVKPLFKGESFDVLIVGLGNEVVLIVSLNFANSSGLKLGMPLSTSALASGSSKLSISLCENVVARGGSNKLLALTVFLPSFG
jgi:hypothetical protein